MKHLKRFTTITLAAALLISGGIVSYATADVGSDYSTSENVTFENGGLKKEIDNNISNFNGLVKDKVKDWLSSFNVGSEGYIFPDYYSGGYLSEDGTIVIMSSNIPELQKEFNTLRVKCPDVKLVEVQYSRNELQKIGDEYCETMSDFYTYGVNEKLNKVVFTASEEICEEHSRIAAEKGLPIVFEVGTRVDGSFAMRPSKLLSNSVGYFSSGAVAKDKGGNNYIISCGHEQKVGDVISYNEERIGVVKEVGFSNNKVGDYSIIKLDSGIDISCLVSFGSGTEYLEAVADMDFSTSTTGYMQGGKSRDLGYARFKLSEVNTTISIDGIKIKGISVGEVDPETDENIAVPGDSGSPIYYYDSITGDFTFAGIYSGHTINHGFKYVYFTPQSNLPSSYNVYTLQDVG